MANKIVPYRRDLKLRARELRRNQTPAELILWDSLRKKSLGVEFHRQVPMLDYIVDFYCHEIGLAIEIDGPGHEPNFLEDANRQGRIEAYGVYFLRFKNGEIHSNIHGVLSSIKDYIKSALH